MEQSKANEKFVGDLEGYQHQQKELADILSGAAEVTQSLRMSKEKELTNLSAKVRSDSFKVMVTGTFKNGKSTFINALLGEEVLPAYALPCTAVINEVKYGTEKRALLYFRDPLPTPLPEQLAVKAVRHMEAYKGRKIPPLEIPYDEIEDYVVIPMGTDAEQMKLQSPYEKVELFYPLEILKNGVEIIDSPGLNEDETRTKVTMEYLSKVDAILYVLNAGAICAGDEMKFVENDLEGNNFDSVIFVVNKFDTISKREQPQIRQYAEVKLKQFYPNLDLFCLSAINALDGRLEGDEQMVRESGMVELEKRLAQLLIREKGKVKLAQPARKVRQILSNEALGTVLPKEKKLLATSMDDVQKRYDEIQPRLELLQKDRDSKRDALKLKIERSGRKFERMAKRNMNDMAKCVPVWLEEFTPQTKLGFLPTKNKTEQVVNEISTHLKGKVDEYQREWRENTLQPEIEQESSEIFEAAEQDFSKIFAEIDDINIGLSDGENYSADPVPFWQRVAGVAGGLVIGDIGLAISGGVNGIGKEMAKTAAFELGAGFVLGLLGLLNPFTLFLVIGGVFLHQIGKGSDRALEKLKTAISENVVNKLSEQAEEQAAELSNGIVAKISEVAAQITDAVSREITDVEVQLASVIEEKKSGEATVAKRRTELEKCEERIHSLNNRLDTLIFALVGA